jgi:hypothetical protein
MPSERMGIQHLHFLKLVPTLGSVKSSINYDLTIFGQTKV